MKHFAFHRYIDKDVNWKGIEHKVQYDTRTATLIDIQYSNNPASNTRNTCPEVNRQRPSD